MRGSDLKKLKYSAITLSIFLLILLFAACENPFIPKDIQSYNELPPAPPGSGYFTLSLSSSRSVYPDTPNLSYFDSFDLAFTPVAGNGTPETYTDLVLGTGETSLQSVILAEGVYDLVVTAYKGSTPKVLAASGELKNIEITSGKNTGCTVILKTLLNSGTGNFKWKITYPADVTKAEMKIFDSASATPVQIGSTVTLTNGVEESLPAPLSSGTYNLVFNLEWDGLLGTTNDKTLEWKEILFIYSTLESKFVFEFEEKHFSSKKYTVTFVDNILPIVGSGKHYQTYLHGDKIGTSAPDLSSLWSGYTFMGWFTDVTLKDEWILNDPAEKPLYNDLTLYAKWLPKQGFGVTYTPPSDDAPQLVLVESTGDTPLAHFGKIEIYKPGDAVHPGTAEVKVVNASDYTAINWYISSFTGTSPTGKPAILTSGDTVVFDSNESKYNMDGNKIITIEGIKNGAVYTSYLILSVMHMYTVTFFDDDDFVIAEQSVSSSATPITTDKTIFPIAGLYLDTVLSSTDVNGKIKIETNKWRKKGEQTEFNFTAGTITGNLSLYPYWDTPVNLSAVSGNNLVEKAFTYVNGYASAGAYTLLLDQNYTVAARSLSVSNARLTIRSLGNYERIIQASGSYLFSLSSYTNVRLTLEENITLKGTSSSSSLVSMSAGTFNMNAGSKITGHTTTTDLASAVNISGGTFYLRDGAEISGNKSTANSSAANGGILISGGTAHIYGTVTGNFRNTNIPSDIYNSVIIDSESVSSYALQLYSSAIVGVLKLYGDMPYMTGTTSTGNTIDRPSRSLVGINGAKTTPTTLDIIGAGGNMISAVTNIEGKKYIYGNGITLDSTSVSNFKEGNILSTDNNSMPLSYMHYINSGTNLSGNESRVIGRVLPKDTQKPVIKYNPPTDVEYIFNEESLKPLELSIFINDDGNPTSPSGKIKFEWFRNTLNRAEGGTPVVNSSDINTTYAANTGCYYVYTSKYTPDIFKPGAVQEPGTYYYYCIVTNTNNEAQGVKTATQRSNIAEITMYKKDDTTVYAVYDGAQTPNTGISGLPAGKTHEKFKDLENAIKLISLRQTPNDYQIFIDGDQTLSAASTFNRPSPPDDPTKNTVRNITLEPRSGRVTISSPTTLVSSLISISGNSTNGFINLTLKDGITIQGKSGNYAAAVSVSSGNTLVMEADSEIKGNSSTSSTSSNVGGGVRNLGTFEMKGGIISGNTSYYDGAGVNNSGTFNMTGGTISGNYTSYGNGAGVSNTGTFNMSGGSITGNYTTNSSYNGGGVYNNGTMRVGGSAKIIGNTKGGTAGANSNLYINQSWDITTTTANITASERTVIIGDGTNGVPAPTADMSVGVSVPILVPLVNKISSNGASYSGRFTSDHNDFLIGQNGTNVTIGLTSGVNYFSLYMFTSNTSGRDGNTSLGVTIGGSQTTYIFNSSNSSSTGTNAALVRVTSGQQISFTWSASTANNYGRDYCAFIACLASAPPNPMPFNATSWAGTAANNLRASWKIYGSAQSLRTITVP